MKFLNPNILWGLFLIFIPLIIHLFNFRKYTTVYFSNVNFLQSIKKESKAKSTLRDILILIGRILAVIFIVFAFAQPYIPLVETSYEKENSLVTIYIDNSFSMEAMGKDGMLLESAKMKAIDLGNGFGDNAKFMLLTNDFAVSHRQIVSKQQLMDWIPDITVSHYTRGLNEVVNYQQFFVDEVDTSIQSYFYILSDFQKSSTALSAAENAGQMHFITIPFEHDNIGNLSIDSVWFKTPDHYIGKKEELIVRVKNYSENELNEIPVSLWLNDTLKTQKNINIASGLTQEISLPFIQNKYGKTKARASISDFPITFDNSIYFNYSIEAKTSVLMVNEKGVYPYLEKLFDQISSFNVSSVNVNKVPYNQFNNYQLIILNGLTAFNSGIAQQLSAFVKQGGTIVILPALGIDLASYNQLSAGLNLILWNPWLKQKGNLGNLNIEHRLLKEAIKDVDEQTFMPSYEGYFGFNINVKTLHETLYESASHKPLLVHQKVGNGDVFMSALPLDKALTNLMYHPIFVPIFYNLALQSIKFAPLYYNIQPSMVFELNDEFDQKSKLVLMSDLSQDEFYPSYKASNGFVRIFPDASKLNAGTYHVSFGDTKSANVSFNYSRLESDVRAYSKEEIENLFNEAGLDLIQNISSNAKMDTKIDQINNGKQLDRLLVLLALIMLFLEALLIRIYK